MKNTIQKIPIHDLEVSTKFAAECEKMGYPTLESILSESAEKIRSNKDFSYSWLLELIGVLKKYGLLNKFQPTQGDSRV